MSHVDNQIPNSPILNYSDEIKDRLRSLLERRRRSNKKEERALQTFFEMHPSSILGCLVEVKATYDILGNCIITQPWFKSNEGDRIPDFLITTWDSGNIYFNFIEIEDPSKKIFNANEISFSLDFNQAYHQLKEWRSFYKRTAEDYCNDLLNSLFKDNFNNTGNKELHYNYILIYGFSDEVEGKGKRGASYLQTSFTEPDLHHCTYSRLYRNYRFDEGIFCIRKDYKLNKFKAVGLSPFNSYKPSDWSELHNIIGKEDIIKVHPFISDSEKNDLIQSIQNLDKMSLAQIHQLMFNSLGPTFS